MEGHGSYNRSSRVQATGLLPAVALLERAAKTVAVVPSPHAIVIADYGSSQGHNSLLPMAVAIGALRERLGPEQPISIVHTDLPDNDFTGLFHTLESDPDSYLRNDPSAYASAVGRSFYEQLLPPESVTLGWTSWSVQWLSRMPVAIPDHVQVAYSRDEATRDAFARQAAEDWRLFLIQRSRELCHGGRLVVLTMAIDDAGRFGYQPLLDAMYASLTEMARDGFISREELRRMAIPTVGRSRAELSAPFVGGRFSNLSITHLEIFAGEDRIWSEFQTSGNASAFGAQWAAFSRASVFPTLAAALKNGIDDPRHAAFLDRLEAGLATRLAAAPAHMGIPLAALLLIKER